MVKFRLGASNPISKVFLFWVFSLLDADVNSLHLRHKQHDLVLNNYSTSLSNALYKSFSRKYFLLAIFKVLWTVLTAFSSYWLLKQLIIFNDHFYAAILFFTISIAQICWHQLVLGSTLIGVKARANLIQLIYLKSLKLATISNISDVVNLISNDCNRIAEAFVNLHFLWSSLLETIVIMSLVCFDINGIIGLLIACSKSIAAIPASVLVIFILFPLQFYFAYKASKILYERTLVITKRVNLIAEIVTTIKLIKFYAWEKFYLDKITDKRVNEIKMMKKGLALKIGILIIVFVTPPISAFFCLIAYRYLGISSQLDAASVFSLLSLLNTLRYPMLMMPVAVRTTTAARVSMGRLEDFFNLPEIDDPIQPINREAHHDPKICMEINNAFFEWNGDLEHPHIQDITFSLFKGKILGVVGDVGSGKSLLAGLMGQLKLTKGSVLSFRDGPSSESLFPKPKGVDNDDDTEIDDEGGKPVGDSLDKGSVDDNFLISTRFGYVPQEPWLIEASLRDNIVFGEDWNEERYADVVRLCGLMNDIMLLSEGDFANVNELNLSPSQRQRISLARCLYHDPDIILLEDCFGDFDTKSAKTIFTEVIKGFLMKKDKCVVFYTQQKQFLKYCDEILVLKNGSVIEKGSYTDLKAQHVNFSTYVSDYNPPIEDDPQGLLEKVNEIRLLPSTTSNRPMNRQLLDLLKKPMRGSSPLATAQVISNEPVILDMPPVDVIDDDNNLTIRSIKLQNQISMQKQALNEHTISKMIEKNQLSILTSHSPNNRKPPTNFINQDIVSSTIQQNSLTIHSEFELGGGGSGGESYGGDGIVNQESNILDHPFSYYDLYLNEATGRFFGIVVIIVFVLVTALRFGSDYWLGHIVTEFLEDNLFLGFDFLFLIYGLFSAAIFVGILLRGWAFSATVVKKSLSLHDRVLKAVLRAPISFYDVTPVGHILSIFARHLYLIDDTLPEGWLQMLSFIPLIVGTVIIVCIFVPYIWATLPVFFFLVWWLLYKCNAAERRLRAVEASNTVSIFAHMSATLEGLFSIRLYQTQYRFAAFNQTLVDSDHKTLYSLMSVRSLQALYIDIISCLFVYVTCVFCVVFKVSPVNIGLVVSNAMQLLLFAQWSVRVTGEVHSTMKSVGNVIYFANKVPAEAAAIIKDSRPPKDWPSEGQIEFHNVVLKYSLYGVAVLKQVSFKISPGEKIGIVGRSGSGKTTLLVALLRITELSEGGIFIDNLDISKFGLKDLRSRIAVIPQEPVLMTGTIRSNLDPFNMLTDDQIWMSLQAVHLKTKIEEMPAKLETAVTENGKAFIIAERQLFCIARAILLKTKILVFDEPIEFVDTETDQLIQQTIKENFSMHTVIVLASRFNLIMESDRIIVMDSGKIVEFDTPLGLLDNPRSKFMKMVNQSGDIDIFKLRKLAMAKIETAGVSELVEAGQQNNEGGISQFKRVAASNSSVVGGSESFLFPPQTYNTGAPSELSSQASIQSTANSIMPKSLEGIFVNPMTSVSIDEPK